MRERLERQAARMRLRVAHINLSRLLRRTPQQDRPRARREFFEQVRRDKELARK